MVHVAGPDRLTAVGDADIGDVVVYTEHDRRAVAVVLETDKKQGPLVGMLEGDDLPRLRRLPPGELCAHYGSDGLVEPRSADSRGPGRVEAGRRAGLLVLTEHGWLMNFASSGIDGFGRFNFEWRNLETGEFVKSLGQGIVYEDWVLWSDADDRLLPKGEPMLTYHAEQQRGRSG